MPQQLQVTQKQEVILRQLIRRAKSPQNTVTRAKIVLAGMKFGHRNQQIARELGINYQTVATWRGRWQAAKAVLAEMEASSSDQELAAAILALISDQPRSGAPATFSAEQICQIIAVACEAPELSERPITEWTPRELADEVIKREIVATISPTQVGRFLKRGGVATASESVLAEQ